MKILIATPLFPPDIADPAPYIKELAHRLTNEHTVTVLAYGKLPEDVKDVSFVTVSKQLPTLIRLTQFTIQLLRQTQSAEKVLVQNGLSTELPAFIVSLLFKNKLVLMMTDQKVTYTGWRAVIHQKLVARIITIQTNMIVMPEHRPIVMPLEAYPDTAFRTYEASWDTHLSNLSNKLS